MGKIPLTNAELIKALFLNSSNFPNSDRVEIRLRQLEIASEWDRMEYSLKNDELWYFINNSENELPTRIEFIFDIMKDIDGVKNGNDQYSTFRFFSEKFNSKSKDEIDRNWKEIKRIFQTIEEWFTDRELYHKIGYLITTGEEIKELLEEVKDKQKQKFKNLLDIKIAEKVKCGNLEELEYGNDNKKITNILLLHNIELMLNNENDLQKFPFNKYKRKRDGWSLEHIHAQNSREINEYDDFKIWYNAIDEELKQEISKELKDEIVKLENQDENCKISISELISKISVIFGEFDINTIDNLALLSKIDNSSLNNKIFPLKRKKIIELEKKGSFIPIATKNVFQKYYDGCTKQLSKWEEKDRIAYLESIKTTVFQKLNNI